MADPGIKPYLTYITNQYTGGEELVDEWLDFFVVTVQHFRSSGGNQQATAAHQNAGGVNEPPADSLRALIDRMAAETSCRLLADTRVGTPQRMEQAEDKITFILGIWTMLENSFRKRNRSRAIVCAYDAFAAPTNPPKTPYHVNLRDLISGSGLLPGGARDLETDTERDTMNLAASFTTASTPSTQGSGQNISSQLLGSSHLSSGWSLETLPLVMMNSSLTRNEGLPRNARLSFQSLADIDAVESQSIVATRVNALTLHAFSAVEVRWTYNISRHMLLASSNDRHVLELFCLPSAFQAIKQPSVGMSSGLLEEIHHSYAILFNAWNKEPKGPLHTRLWSIMRIRSWCWCWSCSAFRYQAKCAIDAKDDPRVSKSRLLSRNPISSTQDAFDPLLVKLMQERPYLAWSSETFPNLWTRIVRLEQHLQTSRPWSIWVLFRDRRDTFQFWTFL